MEYEHIELDKCPVCKRDEFISTEVCQRMLNIYYDARICCTCGVVSVKVPVEGELKYKQ